MIDKFVEEKLLTDKRQHRAYRGKPLNGYQKCANKSRCKVRAKVEHVFAWSKNWRQRFQIRSIGLVRAGFAIGMNNLIYNMRRLVFLSDKVIC
ncbi:MAG: transposase [Holosporales bacterium]|nr:transposase [Holosporales bacterium]